MSSAIASSSAPSSEQVRDAVAARLQAVGQRLTTNRQALLDALTAAARPLTIPEILDERPDLAQSSAYRNLVVLEEAGVVHRVVGTDEFARWELTEDLSGHHHHLICASCGRVEDVPASAGLERSVAAAAAAITRTTGFRTQHHRLDLVGVCESCS
jgi:Fur family ferric uptake transcriptional regulator